MSRGSPEIEKSLFAVPAEQGLLDLRGAPGHHRRATVDHALSGDKGHLGGLSNTVRQSERKQSDDQPAILNAREERFGFCQCLEYSSPVGVTRGPARH